MTTIINKLFNFL